MLGIAALACMMIATFTATATACMMTGDGAPHAAAPGSATTGSTHHQHHAAAPAADEASTEEPSNAPPREQPVPACCKAFAPCTPVVAAAAVLTVPETAASGTSIVALGELTPDSRLVAPDTPPPKA